MRLQMLLELGDAWSEGYDAFRDGLDNEANPYQPGTIRFSEWLDGWNARASEKAS